jgi:hypothetical protein
MFEWLFDIVGCNNINTNTQVYDPEDLSKKKYYQMPNPEDKKYDAQIQELRYDNLKKHFALKPNMKVGEWTYRGLITNDISILLEEEINDLNNLSELHVAIKWVLVGAFFASIASYKNSDLAQDRQVYKLFLEQEPDKFLKSGSNLFMMLKRYYGYNKSNMLIDEMVDNHQEIMDKVSKIAAELSENLKDKTLNIDLAKIKSIIIENVKKYCPKEENQEAKHEMLIEEIDKQFSFPKIISQEKAAKLNTALTFAKLLLAQILLERQHFYNEQSNDDDKVITDSTNHLLSSLGIKDYTLNKEIFVQSDIQTNSVTNITIFDNQDQDSNTGYKIEEVNLSSFFGPDDDQAGNAIKISSIATDSTPRTIILDWIKIIENSDVKQYLLSQNVIQSIQKALLQMLEKIEHATKTNWVIPFALIESAKNDYMHHQQYQATIKPELYMFHDISGEIGNHPMDIDFLLC